MTKRRGRLSDEELELLENNIARSEGILRRILRSLPVIGRFIVDPDVGPVVKRDLNDVQRLAQSMKQDNKAWLEKRREEKRNK